MRATPIIFTLVTAGCPGWTDTGALDTGLSEALPAAGVVEGRACAPAGSYVFISQDWDRDGVEDGRFEAWTDEEGWFRLEGVPEGSWRLHVEQPDQDGEIALVLWGETGAWALAGCGVGDESAAAADPHSGRGGARVASVTEPERVDERFRW